MIFPFEWLSAGGREIGLVVAVGIGFGFGFVLERAGFGRAPLSVTTARTSNSRSPSETALNTATRSAQMLVG